MLVTPTLTDDELRGKLIAHLLTAGDNPDMLGSIGFLLLKKRGWWVHEMHGRWRLEYDALNSVDPDANVFETMPDMFAALIKRLSGA